MLGVYNNIPGPICSGFKENTAVSGVDPQNFYQCFRQKSIGEIKISCRKMKERADKCKTKKEKEGNFSNSEQNIKS